MIGNDVIDIAQSRVESNWQRKGFLEKLFSAEEQLLISRAQDPEMMVWLFWSMKEAAYKIHNRNTKITAFIPHKLICSLMAEHEQHITGKVQCEGNFYYTKTAIDAESIHTIAVYNFKDLDKVIQIENKNIVKDQHGIPYLATLSNTLKDVSISHHGRFEKVVCIAG